MRAASFRQEFKMMAPIAGPAVLSQLAQMAMGVIDTLMAGHHSNEALAAVAIGANLLHPVLVFLLGLFLAFNPMIAHMRGAGQVDRIGPHFRLAMGMGLVFTPVAFMLLRFSTRLLGWLGVEEGVARLASDYVDATTWGMLGFLVFLGLRFCNEGMFSTPAIMAATLVSIPFNIGFNQWFMYGGWGIEAMGAVGVGYATSLVWSLMCLGLGIYTWFAPKYRPMMIFKGRELPGPLEAIEVFKIGLPVAVTVGFEVSMFAAVALMIARYPVEVMGGHQIAINIASLMFMVPLGIAQATTARVGFFSGRRDGAAMRCAGFTGVGVATLFACFSGAMMVGIPRTLVGFYTQDPEVISIAVTLLFFAAVFQLSDGLQVSSAGALRGLKDTKMPMAITACAYWLIGLPTGYGLAEWAGMGVRGYWIGLTAGLTTAASLLFRRWIVRSKSHPADAHASSRGTDAS